MPTHIVLSGEQRKKEWKLINVYLILPKVILTTLQEAWISIHLQHVAENREKALDVSVEYNQHKDLHEYHNNMEKAVKNSKKAEDLFQAEEETRKVRRGRPAGPQLLDANTAMVKFKSRTRAQA